MLRYILNIALLLFASSLVAQTDTVAHLYTFGGLETDNAEEIEATADGGYIVVGSTSSNGSGNTDVYLLKIDSLCNYQWSKSIGGINNDWGYSVKQTYDKGYIVAASSNSYGNGGYNACLIKRDSLGGYQWKKTYGGNDWDFVYSVVQTLDSGYAFCGETYNNTNGLSDVYVVKTNKTGDALWTKTIGNSLMDRGNAIIETSDTNLIIAGITNTTTDSTQIYLIKLSENGTLIWDSIYGDSLYDVANSVIETNNGDYVVVGGTNSFSVGGDEDYLIMKVDKNGTQSYSQTPLNSANDDEIKDVVELPNGDLFVTGFTKTIGGAEKEATVILLDSLGVLQGVPATYGSSLKDDFNSITIGNNGSLVMAGASNSYGNGSEDVFVVRADTIYTGQDTSVTNYVDIIPLFVKEVSGKSNIVIFPNPTVDNVKVSINEFTNAKTYYFYLYDINGRELKSVGLMEKSNILNLQNISEGMYVYKVLEDEMPIEKGKLIIH